MSADGGESEEVAAVRLGDDDLLIRVDRAASDRDIRRGSENVGPAASPAAAVATTTVAGLAAARVARLATAPGRIATAVAGAACGQGSEADTTDGDAA